MSIKVRFFASLRESLGDNHQLENQEIETINDVWNALSQGQSLPANTLMALNMEYVDADAKVNDGDEVAFFPPVTGG